MQKGWHKWTAEMDSFLLSNYEWIGDKYLAEMFEERFSKGYPWTKKHIEKRRSYLGLTRTPEQLQAIHFLNNQDGRHFKSWDKRGRIKEGEVKNWKGRRYIKHNGKVMLYGRYLTKARQGQIARWTGSDYKLISMAEHARTNKRNSMMLPEDLKQTIKTLNKLKKLVYGKENTRPARNTV